MDTHGFDSEPNRIEGEKKRKKIYEKMLQKHQLFNSFGQVCIIKMVRKSHLNLIFYLISNHNFLQVYHLGAIFVKCKRFCRCICAMHIAKAIIFPRISNLSIHSDKCPSFHCQFPSFIQTRYLIPKSDHVELFENRIKNTMLCSLNMEHQTFNIQHWALNTEQPFRIK